MKKMISKFKERLANAKNNEGGFTLVELIVVIVILAILIGVTVGGVNKNIAKSRVNTDINNAASIQSVLSTLGAEEDVYKAAHGLASDTTIKFNWTKGTNGAALAANSIKIGTGETATDITGLVNSILTDGLPESKTGDGFVLQLSCSKDGSVSVKCQALADENATLTADGATSLDPTP